MQRIQQLPERGRKIVFYGIMAGGVVALAAITVWLIYGAINSQENRVSIALEDGVTVREFAALPGNDAYPATVSASFGTVVSGSYQTGAVWTIDADGVATEIPGTRDAIGAVSGIVIDSGGTIFIVDQLDTDPRTSGGDVKRISRGGEIDTLAAIPDERGFVSPDDIALDPAGNVYVSDRGRDEVWRFGNGEATLWWKSPAIEGVTEYAPTGLAYDATTDTMLITDSSLNMIYRVSLDGATTEVIYEHGQRPNPPTFDGITVTSDGTIYVAALGQDGVARVQGNNDLAYIAGLFRGPSDIDYNQTDGTLYVSNFDSGSLVIPGLSPRLPFTIDQITLWAATPAS